MISRTPSLSGRAGQPHIVLLFERVATRLKDMHETAVVITDRPSGGRAEEASFVAECLRSLVSGTAWVEHNEISFVIPTSSKFVRLLQATDVLTSCLTAFVAGRQLHDANARHTGPPRCLGGGRRRACSRCGA